MIIDAVLNIFTEIANLILKTQVEPIPAKFVPSFIFEEQACRVKRGGFGDEMIIILRAGLDECEHDAFCMLAN